VRDVILATISEMSKEMDTGHNSFYSDPYRHKDDSEMEMNGEKELQLIKRKGQKKEVKI
jgi:hypothetical protein